MDILAYQKKILAWPSLKIGHMYMRSMPTIRRNGNESTFRQNIGNSITFQIPANKHMQHMCGSEALHIQHMWRLRIQHTCTWSRRFSRMRTTHELRITYVHTHVCVQDDRNRSHTKHKTNKVTDTARPRVLDEVKSWDWVGYWAKKASPLLTYEEN